LKLHELFEDRVESGPISNEKFCAILADAAAEFQAVQYLKRRRRKSKGRRSSDPIDPPFDAAPTGIDELLEELH
jgi:hypothetical protein